MSTDENRFTAIVFLIVILVIGVHSLFGNESKPNEIKEPVQKERTFNHAKRQLSKMYSENRVTFYCGCTYSEHNEINLASCGYKIRRNDKRAKRLEWEHIVPASYYGNSLPCWKEGGRAICGRESNAFSNFEGDMHNLVPEVGELNGDRSNKIHGVVLSNYHTYGSCNFKVGTIRAEPHDGIKGDVARIWLYMAHKYNIFLSTEMKETFEAWNKLDPVDEYERWRNRRIKEIQGDSNIFIEPVS